MIQQPFTINTIESLRNIPEGKVTTYGEIARMAGNPRAARQVARILHTYSQKESLPWHRVVNREGRIALKTSQGYADQKRLLESEGIEFDGTDAINLELFLWRPEK